MTDHSIRRGRSFQAPANMRESIAHLGHDATPNLCKFAVPNPSDIRMLKALAIPLEASSPSSLPRDMGHWPPQVYFPAPQKWIEVVDDASSLAEIGQLRYALYVERDQKAYAAADHSNRSFLEPVDDVSLNFRAFQGGRTVAAMRLTRAFDALEDSQLARFIQASKVDCLENTVVCSRMVVRPELGARILITSVVQHVYRIALHSGASHCVAGSRPNHSELFKKIGFRQRGTCSDPVSGPMKILVVDLRDRCHLVSVKSPLVAVLDEYELGAAQPKIDEEAAEQSSNRSNNESLAKTFGSSNN
jgi:hypothetical protein